MSFLDSLENNLKALESRDEGTHNSKDERQRRETERLTATAAAPYAEQLQAGAFVKELLTHATAIGHTMRTKVHMAWLGTTLRLEAREKKLELRPTGDGVVAAFFENNVEVRREKIDLSGDPEKLAQSWLKMPLSSQQ
jgi:hypothetical protein